MERCATCKHFKLEDWGYDAGWERYGVCRLTETGMDWDGPKWNHDLSVENRYEPPPPDAPLAFAMDTSNYHAILIVHPEFGCIQWEKA